MFLCAHCKSADVMAGLTMIQCLDCGKLTDTQGRKVPDGPTFSGGEPVRTTGHKD